MSTFHQTAERYALLPLLKPLRPANHLPEGRALPHENLNQDLLGWLSHSQDVTDPHPGGVLFEPRLPALVVPRG